MGRPGEMSGVVAVDRNPLLAIARHGRDDPGRQVDPTDSPIIQIGQVECPSSLVEGDAVDSAELRSGRRAAISREALPAGARKVREPARSCIDPPDPVVPGVGDEDIAFLRDREAMRPVQLGPCRRHVIATACRATRPAIKVTTPSAPILRSRLAVISTKNRVPVESNATPNGVISSA